MYEKQQNSVFQRSLQNAQRVTSEINSLGGVLHKSCSYKWKTVAVFRPFGIQDDNVKCPNCVPRGCYRRSYFFFLSQLLAHRRDLARYLRRGFLRNCNYGRSWRRSSVPLPPPLLRRLIRILLTRRDADVYVFISHQNSTILSARSWKRFERFYRKKMYSVQFATNGI